MAHKDEKARFHEVLDHFDNAMLVTHAGDGHLRARPMALAEADERGHLWFVTGLDTGKVAEAAQDERAAVVCQGGGRYLSISGHVELVEDRQKIAKLWKEPWRVWFPDGPGDPGLVLMHFVPEEAEYWDNHGVQGLKYTLKAAKAYLQGRRMRNGTGAMQHGRLDLS